MLTDGERAWLIRAAETRRIWIELQQAREAMADQGIECRIVPAAERERAEFWAKVQPAPASKVRPFHRRQA